MTSKDKAKLTLWGIIIGIIGIAVLIVFMTRNFLTGGIMCVIFTLGIDLWFLPRIIQYYRILNERECDWKCYIPFYKDSMIMHPVFAVLYILSLVAIVITFFGYFIFSNTTTFLSPLAMSALGFRVMKIVIFEIICMLVIRGIAFFFILLDINYSGYDNSRSFIKPKSFMATIQYITAFIPCIRVIALIYAEHTLQEMYENNEFFINTDNFREE